MGYIKIERTCTHCGKVSTQAFKKYHRYYCIDCLVKHLEGALIIPKHLKEKFTGSEQLELFKYNSLTARGTHCMDNGREFSQTAYSWSDK